MMINKNLAEIKFNRNSLHELLFKFIILIYFCVMYAFFEYRLYISILLVFFLLYYFITRRKNLSLFTLWNVIFIFWCASSYVWSYNSGQTLIEVRILIEIAIISNLIIVFIDKKGKVEFFYKVFIISGLIFIIRLLYEFPLASWFTQRLGSEEFNANTIGLYLTISAICSLHLAQKKNKALYILYFLFSFVVFLTGSRKSFLMLVFGSAILIYFNQGRNVSRKILAVIMGIILIIIGYFMVFNIPFLYDILGNRIESFLSVFFGESNIDYSTETRFNLIDIGISLFLNKPFLGHGIGSYSILSGYYVYSHNNYIELLVGVGLIGTVIYYSMIIYIIVKLYKRRNLIVGNPLLTILIMLLIIDYSLVSYNGFIYQFIIAIGFASTIVIKGRLSKEINSKEQLNSFQILGEGK